MLSSLQFLIHRHVPPNIHWVFDLSSWGSISHQVLWGNIRNDKELTKICTPNRVLALQLTEQALQHRLRWIRHTYPVFTAKISEPAQIIIPIPLKVYTEPSSLLWMTVRPDVVSNWQTDLMICQSGSGFR